MIKGARSNNLDTGSHGAGRATSRQAYTVEACDVGTPITLGNGKRYTIKPRDVGAGLNLVTVTNYDHARALTVEFYQFADFAADLRARHNAK